MQCTLYIFISECLKNVTATTIQHSFGHGAPGNSSARSEVERKKASESVDNVPLRELIKKFQIALNLEHKDLHTANKQLT